MKVALCLFGLVGGSMGKDGEGDNVDYEIAYNHYKKHILDKNDVDVFIHTWSIDFKKELTEIYKPKKSIFEKQIDFREQIDFNVIDRYKDYIQRCKIYIRNIFRKNRIYHYSYIDRAYRAYSRWYSTKKAVELKKQYEQDNNFVYDCVMVSRLDLAFFTDVIFDKFDMDYFYASHWNDAPNINNDYKGNRENHNTEWGFLDLWFFSNSNLMDKFASLYDSIGEYDISPHRSSRQHLDKFAANKIKYVFYRWEDYEIVRRKFYDAVE